MGCDGYKLHQNATNIQRQANEYFLNESPETAEQTESELIGDSFVNLSVLLLATSTSARTLIHLPLLFVPHLLLV